MGKFNLANISDLLYKLKKVKHIEIYAIILGVLILYLFLFKPLIPEKNYTKTSTSLMTTKDYANFLEQKLNSVLSQISGAGEVKCMITLDGDVQSVIAYSNDEKSSSTENTTSSGTSNKTESLNSNSEPILINVNGTSEPLILYQVMPKIQGVIIVASGANNVKVKLDMLKAVQALLSVSVDQIEILY